MPLHGIVPNVQQTVYESKPLVLTYTPTTGSTVTLPNTMQDLLVYMNPAGALLALTMVLPSDTSTYIGQTIRVYFTKGITTLTFTGITPLPIAASLDSGFTIQKVAANMWARF